MSDWSERSAKRLLDDTLADINRKYAAGAFEPKLWKWFSDAIALAWSREDMRGVSTLCVRFREAMMKRIDARAKNG